MLFFHIPLKEVEEAWYMLNHSNVRKESNIILALWVKKLLVRIREAFYSKGQYCLGVQRQCFLDMII